MSDYSKVMREAEEAASGQFAGFVERLAERVGVWAKARAVFGEPVERDGVTVIPVARVRWAFGGGGGTSGTVDDEESDTGAGAGGGGGVAASPVGYIEITGGEAVFRKITDPVSMWPLMVAGAVSTWIVFRAIRGFFR